MKIEEASARQKAVLEDVLNRQLERSGENSTVGREQIKTALNARPEGEASATLPDEEQLEKALAALKERFKEEGPGVTFAVENSGHSINVTVMAKDSDRVLMRIPAEGIVRLANDGTAAIGGVLNKSY